MIVEQWIESARISYLKEAACFLHERGLLPEGQTLGALVARWSDYVHSGYDLANPEPFYRSWQGEVGASNILVNILDQFSRRYVASALHMFFAPPYDYRGTILDFGCGTAAISLNWQRSFAPHATLLLADIENLPLEFVRCQIAKRPDCKAYVHDVALSAVPDNSVDVLMCIDVLEHLLSPSAVFARLHRKLRSGGLLFVQAPWGDHPEHLPQAPIDWNGNGGSERLETCYNRLAQMNDNIELSGIYLKKLLG